MHFVDPIDSSELLGKKTVKKKLRTSNLLCKKPALHLKATETQVTEKIFN